MIDSAQADDLVLELSEKSDSDLYLYSGPISRDGANLLIQTILHHENRRSRASVVLTTYGGDADAAYRMARFIQGAYGHFRLLIPGPCKSAGTLVATGADVLAFAITGEIGPLDIQLAKPDELANYASGLSALRAYTDLRDYTYQTFEAYLLATLERSGGLISTKTAADFACGLIAHLVPPIASQIDPYRLAEVGRAMRVASEYAARLDKGNMRLFGIYRLVHQYPAHGFVIDANEASDIFYQVESMTAEEYDIVTGQGVVASVPSDEEAVRDLVLDAHKRRLTRAAEAGYAQGAAGQAATEPAREDTDAQQDPGSEAPSPGAEEPSRPIGGEGKAGSDGDEAARIAEDEGAEAEESGPGAAPVADETQVD